MSHSDQDSSFSVNPCKITKVAAAAAATATDADADATSSSSGEDPSAIQHSDQHPPVQNRAKASNSNFFSTGADALTKIAEETVAFANAFTKGAGETVNTIMKVAEETANALATDFKDTSTAWAKMIHDSSGDGWSLTAPPTDETTTMGNDRKPAPLSDLPLLHQPSPPPTPPFQSPGTSSETTP